MISACGDDTQKSYLFLQKPVRNYVLSDPALLGRLVQWISMRPVDNIIKNRFYIHVFQSVAIWQLIHQLNPFKCPHCHNRSLIMCCYAFILKELIIICSSTITPKQCIYLVPVTGFAIPDEAVTFGQHLSGGNVNLLS